MRISFGAIVVFLFVCQAWSQAAPGLAGLIGSWEGESKCTVPDSPCHDEHALYRITAQQENPGQLNMDGYKVVDGSPQFMGSLLCQYQAEKAILRCTAGTGKQDDWEFHVSGNSMTGTLTIGPEKRIYRRISVRKKQ